MHQYKAVRLSTGIEWPGYMIHESGVWSPFKKKWYFLPRRCSHETYNETRDEVMGCNYMISADNSFKNIKATEVCKNFILASACGASQMLTFITNLEKNVFHFKSRQNRSSRL